MINFDVIILSKGSTDELRDYTSKCIESLLRSEDPGNINFNILILESEEGVYYDYEKTNIIYTGDILGKFNYSKYCNYGIKNSNFEYVALCNNDIVFEPGWASAIVKVADSHPDVLSFGTVCPEIKQNIDHTKSYQEGYDIREYITGWCIVTKRELYSIIPEFSEDFEFWYFDNYYGDLLKDNKLKHYRVNRSYVHHHSNDYGKTVEDLSDKEIYNITHKQTKTYNNYIANKMKPEIYKNNLNSFFDEIFVINLTKDDQRYQDSLKIYNYLDVMVTRWNATPNIIFNGYAKHLNNQQVTGNYIACLNSHLTVIEHAYTKGHEKILIIEDDIIPIKDFNKRFDIVINELPAHWDMLYLSYIRTDDSKNIWTYVGLDDDKITENVVQAKNFWSGMAYALNRSMMERILNYYKVNPPIEIDRFYVEFVQNNPLFNCYGSVPQLFAGVDNYSNNTNKNENIFDRSINNTYVGRDGYYQPDDSKIIHINDVVNEVSFVNSKWDDKSYNHMKSQFNKYGINFKRYDKIEDILYYNNIINDSNYDPNFIISKNDYNKYDSFYYLSHFNIMHNNNNGNVCYIQDSINFTPSFNYYFDKYYRQIPKDFDICLLGGNIIGDNYTDHGDYIIISGEPSTIRGLNGYIVSNRFRSEYINLLETYKLKSIDIDIFFEMVLQGLPINIVAPKEKLIY